MQTNMADLQARLDAAAAALEEFRAHMLGPKFQAAASDPDRRDWIATADVLDRLSNINNALQN